MIVSSFREQCSSVLEDRRVVESRLQNHAVIPHHPPAITSSTPRSPALSVDLNVAFNRRKVSPRWRRNDMPVSVSATSGAKRRAEVRGGEVREEDGPGAPPQKRNILV